MWNWLEQLADWRFRMSMKTSETLAIYDALTPRYDRWHSRWLKSSGNGAWTALRACLASELRPGIAVLDAGCGTGTVARWMLEKEPELHLTLLDAAPGMIIRAMDLPCEHVFASVLELPFPAARFDLVVCAWVLETIPDASTVASELMRVLKPGGLFCCCSVAQPETGPGGITRKVRQWLVERFFGGRCRTFRDLEMLFPKGRCLLTCDEGQTVFLCVRKAPADLGEAGNE